ncbi:hypothetical protein HJG60_008584 [Phyllostomus discolor]|uniref:Uncharacterized protein n=1 Tax=Phyllostomus discolor TaxID=89673 RepID=A0A833Z1A1_9CHIR|nr:hypothetical protein HJG60_008584 [Phyllostomus discolor]
MAFFNLKLKFIFIGNILPFCKEDLALHFSIFYKKHIEWGEAAEVEGINIAFHSQLQVIQTSIFMTEPKVLRGRETSILWFGISGMWTARGVLGITPRLFLSNWIAKSVMCCRALLLKFISL